MSGSTSGVALVVSDQGDFTADLIIGELNRRGAEVVRLDPTATPLHLDCVVDGGRWRGFISAGGGRRADLDRVTSVLFRWPSPPPGHPAIADGVERAWAAIEDAQALAGVLKSLPIRWMNYPDAVIASASKPLQLRDAVAAGMHVPATHITTTGTSARAWAHGRQHKVLYKSFRAEMQGTLITARKVDAAELPDELLSAGIIQQVIEGTPIRTTVVGDDIFSAAITGHRGIDWRPDQGDAEMVAVDTPEDVAVAIRSLMARWGLVYGAFDFIADGDQWWFLECNPAGQYGLVEYRTGLPITETIADWLTQREEV